MVLGSFKMSLWGLILNKRDAAGVFLGWFGVFFLRAAELALQPALCFSRLSVV